MIKLTKANGTGCCAECKKPIAAGVTQFLIKLGSGMYGKSARICMPCLFTVLKEKPT